MGGFLGRFIPAGVPLTWKSSEPEGENVRVVMRSRDQERTLGANFWVRTMLAVPSDSFVLKLVERRWMLAC